MVTNSGIIFLMFLLATVSFTIIFLELKIYRLFIMGSEDFLSQMSNGSIPIGVIGFFMTVFSLYGLVTSPLPGYDNTLVYVPFSALGIILIALLFTTRYSEDLSYVGFISLIAGLTLIILDALGAYSKISQESLTFALLYALGGISAIILFPITLSIDSPGKSIGSIGDLSMMKKIMFIILALSEVIIGILAITYVIQMTTVI